MEKEELRKKKEELLMRRKERRFYGGDLEDKPVHCEAGVFQEHLFMF